MGGLRHRESADPADPEVIAAAGRLAFQEWLVRQRADAMITWHW
ncbi:hypothetical protein ACFSKW_17590 [Nonomuraea mangrovi]|uniref:Uncharacterized protein n=1 Tax=Nonomuraea mangrovi TaxID=2316207 RepID=A0ABW4SUQ2_9ACTN